MIGKLIPHFRNQKLQIMCVFHFPDYGVIGRLGVEYHLPELFPRNLRGGMDRVQKTLRRYKVGA